MVGIAISCSVARGYTILKPHSRALVFAFVRQIRGMLAAVELFLAEDDKLEQQPKEPENKRILRLPKNPK